MSTPYRLVDPEGKVVYASVDTGAPPNVGDVFDFNHKRARITKVEKLPDGSEDRHIRKSESSAVGLSIRCEYAILAPVLAAQRAAQRARKRRQGRFMGKVSFSLLERDQKWSTR